MAREKAVEQADAQAREADGFDVQLQSGDLLSATKLLLAFGVSDILPDIPGLAERWGIDLDTAMRHAAIARDLPDMSAIWAQVFRRTPDTTPVDPEQDLYGGFVISGREDDRWFAVPSGVDPRISVVVFVPPTPLAMRIRLNPPPAPPTTWWSRQAAPG